jgi:hypothetical protein
MKSDPDYSLFLSLPDHTIVIPSYSMAETDSNLICLDEININPKKPAHGNKRARSLDPWQAN